VAVSSSLKWSELWQEYPDYINYPDSAEVKQSIGGNVDASWITNTCAIRLSATLNANGVPVPSGFPGLATVKGGDGKRYAIRVREMRKWLEHKLGKPDFDHKKKAGAAFDKSPLGAMKGIIGFDIRFSDATGHLDLWDGTWFSSEYQSTTDYWEAATRISLWKVLLS
jgi:hypothetical protein